VKAGYVTAMRVVTALLCASGGIILLLCWGLGMKFWSLLGIIVVIMAFAGAYFIAGRDYAAGATPTGLAAVISVFVLFPPENMLLLAVLLLFGATGLAYALYEVD